MIICRFAPKFASRLNHNLTVAYAVIFVVWVFFILWVAVGTGIHSQRGSLFYTPTPYWCWVASKYMGERIAGEYLWLWLTLFTSVIIYIPLFLWSRGNLVFESHWTRPRLRWFSAQSVHMDRQRKTTFLFLLYPLAYALVVLPLTIIRWTIFANPAKTTTFPSGWTFFAQIFFSLSGLVNVLLLRFTRPGLLLFQPSTSTIASRMTGTYEGRAPSIRVQSTSFNEEFAEDVIPTFPEPAYDRRESSSATRSAFLEGRSREQFSVSSRRVSERSEDTDAGALTATVDSSIY